MADNPFDDPAINEQSPLASGGAYDDDNDNDKKELLQIDVQDKVKQDISIAQNKVDAIKDEYDKSTAQQTDIHSAPPPPTYCIKLFRWFPLRYFAFLGGLSLIICPILDLTFGTAEFVQFFIYVLLIVFGITTCFIESPIWRGTRRLQLKIFFWFRILSRMWGRGWFYIFASILCFSDIKYNDAGEMTFIAGLYVFIIALLSFLFSRLSARKYLRIYTYIAAGKENNELKNQFINKYKNLDINNQNKIGSIQLTKVSNEAGRILSNSERYAIQTFLDESCNGFIEMDDWLKQFIKYHKIRFL